MKFAIIVFPGSNCERDMFYTVTDDLGQQAEYVSCMESSPNALDFYDAVLIPGGSSYGDIPRPGAAASKANIFNALRKFNKDGKPILGICNGFQILTEAGFLPGVLLANTNPNFICKTTPIKIVSNNSIFTNQYKAGQIVNYPIAHGHGNYHCCDATLEEMKANGQILFTYEDNPNGSVANIAGITNKAGNVLGLMPHPERAVDMLLGNDDGLALFSSIIQ
ncbi:MAG: phosphoribosylformylglycinamidine synthase subunit PurQ [Firmicutes bacterium]|nr:phosphoribosylformylglycinamidine synthase subunit PurQ [Bacillota bacterium]